MNTAENNIVPLKAGGAMDRSKAQAVLGEIASLAGKYLPPLLQSMLDKADTALFEMGNKAENSTEQDSYHDAMRQLRRVRAEIETGFKRSIQQAFSGALQGKAAGGGSRGGFSADSLSLVDEGELEESLAIKGMVDKIHNVEAKLLDALGQRMQHLLAAHGGKPSDYPGSAQQLCDGFAQALDALEADLKVRLLLYKLFDLNVVANLAPFYESANGLLARAGILPELPKPMHRAVVSPSRERTRESGGDKPSSATTDGEDTEVGLMEVLQELLHNQGGANMVPIMPGASLASGQSFAPVDAMQLTQVLTRMQQQLESAGNAIDSDKLKQLIAGDLQGPGQENLAGFQQRESMMIDVVAMLFGVILEDRDIPDVARAQIARLQIPMVKVALLDDSFLSKKSHPARVLLNRLAQLCAELDAYVDGETPVLIEVKRVVDSIASDFDSDMGVFERELESLELFMTLRGDEQEQIASVIDGVKGRHEQQERGRIQVEETLRIKLAMIDEGAEVPEVVRNVITGPWRQTLLHTIRQHGEESAQWRERSELVDRLIDSIQPRGDKAARGQLLKAIPPLVMGLRKGMLEAGIDNDSVIQVLKIIEPLHMAILTPVKAEAAEAEKLQQSKMDKAISAMEAEMADIDQLLDGLSGSLLDEEDAAASAIPDEFMEEVVLSSEQEEVSLMVDDEFIEAIREIQVGQMVILHDKHDNPVRCKVAWKSDYLGEYVFTNWRHKVVAERTVNSLAADLYRGRLELVEHTPILERALTTVFTTLKGQRGQGGELQTEPG